LLSQSGRVDQTALGDDEVAVDSDGAGTFAPVLEPASRRRVLGLEGVDVVDAHLEVVLDDDVPLTRRTFPSSSSTATRAATTGVRGAVACGGRRVAVTVDVGATSSTWRRTVAGTGRCRGKQDRGPGEEQSRQDASAHPATPSNCWRSRASDTFHTPSTRSISAWTLWVLTESSTTSPVS